MKDARKWLTLALTVVLAVCLAVPALAADSAAPEETAAMFMAMLDQDGVEYVDRGIDSDGDYSIEIYYPGDYKEEHDINLYIDKSGNFFSAYEWYLIEYDGARLEEVLETVNELNMQYRFVTFVADTSDDTITAKTYGVLRGEAAFCADILHYAYEWLPLIVDDSWNALTTGVPAAEAESGNVPAEEPAAAGMAGTWYFSSMELEEGESKLSLTADMLGGRELFILRLSEDGAAELVSATEDETEYGTWTQEGDTGSLEIDGEPVRLLLTDEDTLQVDATEQAGFVLIMVRDDA